MLWKTILVCCVMTLTLDLETSFKVNAHLWSKALCGWSMCQIWPRGENIFSRQGFSNNSAMTLTLDLETLFKVTAQLSPKKHSVCEVWARWGYLRERRNALDKWSQRDGWVEGQRDGQTDYYRLLAEQGLKYIWSRTKKTLLGWNFSENI